MSAPYCGNIGLLRWRKNARPGFGGSGSFWVFTRLCLQSIRTANLRPSSGRSHFLLMNDDTSLLIGSKHKHPLHAVVIGSGPNGLSAAIVLAQAGWQVDVYEAQPTIGGASRTLPLTLPGFQHDFGSAIHAMAAGSPFFSTLPLAKHGLEWVHAPAPLAHPFDDGTAITLERDLDDAERVFGSDGKRWRSIFGPLAEHWNQIAKGALRPLVHFPAHPFLMARFGTFSLVSAPSWPESPRTPSCRWMRRSAHLAESCWPPPPMPWAGRCRAAGRNPLRMLWQDTSPRSAEAFTPIRRSPRLKTFRHIRSWFATSARASCWTLPATGSRVNSRRICDVSGTALGPSSWTTPFPLPFRGRPLSAPAPERSIWAEQWKKSPKPNLQSGRTGIRTGHLSCSRSLRCSIPRARLRESTSPGPTVTCPTGPRLICLSASKHRSSASRPVSLKRWTPTSLAGTSMEGPFPCASCSSGPHHTTMLRPTRTFFFARPRLLHSAEYMACVDITLHRR